MMLMMIPIVVTLVGIVTDVSAEHEINTASPKRRVRVSINTEVDHNDDDTNSGDTCRNSNRRQHCTSLKGRGSQDFDGDGGGDDGGDDDDDVGDGDGGGGDDDDDTDDSNTSWNRNLCHKCT